MKSLQNSTTVAITRLFRLIRLGLLDFYGEIETSFVL